MSKCSHCRKPATMGNAVQRWCSIECAMALIGKAKAKKAKAEESESRQAAKNRKQAHREAKAKVKRHQDLRAEVQTAFNRMIRARDAGLPCISCKHPDNGTRQRHAGHYLTVGAHPELRYNEENCHGQCVKCNHWEGGGLHPGYRTELIIRIGMAKVMALEGPHAPARWTNEQLHDMKKHFAAEARRYQREKSQ